MRRDTLSQTLTPFGIEWNSRTKNGDTERPAELQQRSRYSREGVGQKEQGGAMEAATGILTPLYQVRGVFCEVTT